MDAGRKPAFSPVCESLEDRNLMAAQVTANLSGGLLRIDGTNLPDRILVRQINNRISVDGVAIAVNGQKQANVSAASVQRIEIHGYAGDDQIGLNSEAFRGQQPLRKPTVVWAGSGNDKVWGGWGNDTIHGEDGNDTLLGNEGNDILDGGAGNDRLDGGNGNDSLDGGTGNDVLLGRSGNDAEKGGAGNDVLGGGYGNDTITGGTGFNQMSGDAGRDVFFSQSGSDRIDGGTDYDVAHFQYALPPRAIRGDTAIVGLEGFIISSSTTTVTTQTTAPKPFEAEVNQLLSLTNSYRVQNGRVALVVDAKLTAAAQYQADYMARTGDYSHTNLDGRGLGDRVRAAGYSFSWVGENIHLYDPAIARTWGIARQYSLAELPNYFFDGWQISPAHNENMLATEPLQIGIAMARSSTGLIYAVQVLGRH